MMPRHYLFVMWEGFGSVPPELGVARRLIARGHRVTVLGDDSLREEAETVVAAFLGYEKAPNRASRDRDDDPVRDWTASDPIESIKMGVTGFMCDPALGVALDVLECHRRDPVNVVVGCALRFGTVMAAEKAGLPSVVLFPNVDLRWAPGRPGFGPGLPPLAGPDGEARDAEIWEVARQAFAVGQPSLDHARRELGLPSTTHPWDEWDRATRVLLLMSRHFDYPYEPPERTIFAGPVLDDPAWAGEATDLPAPREGPGGERRPGAVARCRNHAGSSGSFRRDQ